MDDEVTRFLPSRTVIPFPGRQAPESNEPAPSRRNHEEDEPVSGQRALPSEEPSSERRPVIRSQRATDRRSAAPSPGAATVVERSAEPLEPAPASLAPTAISAESPPRPEVRQFANPGTLTILGLGALAAIFALGMLVGREVTSDPPRPAAVAAAPPAADPITAIVAPAVGEANISVEEARPTVAPAAKPTSIELDRPKEQAVVTLDPVKPPPRRATHSTRRSGEHPVAAGSKRVGGGKPGGGSPVPAASVPRAPTDADPPDQGDDLNAASAADELARAQLEAVMK
jgi:hypothetical protein